jgi:hypothetical protein
MRLAAIASALAIVLCVAVSSRTGKERMRRPNRCGDSHWKEQGSRVPVQRAAVCIFTPAPSIAAD